MAQRVNVFSVQHRPNATRPWIVKWAVDGRHRSRAMQTKAMAERYRSRLFLAVEKGEPFSSVDGEPVSWSAKAETYLELAQRVVRSKWGSWSPMSRRAAVEAIEASCRALLVSGAPAEPPYPPLGPHDMSPVRRWLWDCWLIPEGEARAATGDELAASAWIQRYSIPVREITARTIRSAQPALSLGVRGAPLSADGLGRRRNNLSLVLSEAVAEELLESNPVAHSRWTVAADSDAVEQRQVLGPAECRRLIDVIGAVSHTSDRYTAYLHTLWLAGLRPSEATGLVYEPEDVQLPETGWGRLVLRGGTTYTGKRWTDATKTAAPKGNHTERGLKWRRKGTVRQVPIPPELVRRLRHHIETYEVQVGARIFTNSRGAPVDPGALGKLWRAGKSHAGLQGMQADTRIYDLRHSAATIWLRAGVPVTEVARRLGHSPAVLMRTYAGVLSEDESLGNALIDKALA